MAKGVSACHSSIDYEAYWESVYSQLITLFQEKNTNHFILITCCHILKNCIQKNPVLFYQKFFNKVFGCYLLFVKQPYYRSVALSERDRPSLPISAGILSKANLILLRFCQFGGTILPLLNAITVIIPPLFQLYVFSSNHR